MARPPGVSTVHPSDHHDTIKILVKARPMSHPLDSLLGAKVSKYFCGIDDQDGSSYDGWFEGQVVGHRVEDGIVLYHIRYLDGDEEEMEWTELQQAMKDYQEQARTSESSSESEEKKEDPSIVPFEATLAKKSKLVQLDLRVFAAPIATSSTVTKSGSYVGTKHTNLSGLKETSREEQEDLIDETPKTLHCEDDHEAELEQPSPGMRKRPKRCKKQVTTNKSMRWTENNGDIHRDHSSSATAKTVPKKQRTPKQKSVVAPAKRPAPQPIECNNKKQKSEGVQGYVKKPYKVPDGLPIIKEPQKMFDDMVANKLTNNGNNIDLLLPLLETLHHRTLKVATMCSGTESPILALDMLQKSMRDFCYHHPLLQKHLKEKSWDIERILRIEHVFSCEIEPFKQAYIERNFHPPVLFRDIRELGGDMAYTAYGALTKVPNTPGCVDLLIAGTSCVDYSTLNNQRKNMEEKGESGQTFFGMMRWIKKAQPPLVIIENVKKAPWDAKLSVFNKMGYDATYTFLDTKEYYIPHTRQRGYLFAVRRSSGETKGVPDMWKTLMQQLKRPASAEMEEFMLPNDDARVLRGRERLTAESSSTVGKTGGKAGRTDWSACETRHQNVRASEQLGDSRPLTGWSETGNTKMPAFAWNDWTNAQVHRIHDLMDVNTLRLAQGGIDVTFKAMVWNLSQNVDRDTIGRLGLCQCLTPSGVPYVTSRGGPLVGEELLLLQGIPAEDLLLTKETEDNLKDLAGNAMSSTVVGATILSSLIVGYRSFNTKEDSVGRENFIPCLVPRPLLPPCEIELSQHFAKYEDEDIFLGAKSIQGYHEWSTLLKEANLSARKCISEGEHLILNDEELVVCKKCNLTSSRVNAIPPRIFEEHVFVPLSFDVRRPHPSYFKKKLAQLLPMTFKFANLRPDALDKPIGVSVEIWDEWKTHFNNAIRSEFNGYAKYRLANVERTHVWTATYVYQDKGRVEVRLSDQSLVWYLFASKPRTQGPLSDILCRPIARLVAKPPSGFQDKVSLLNGTWEICLPTNENVEVRIEHIGSKIDSWRKRLGLRGEYETEYEFDKLVVSVECDDTHLKSIVDGVFSALPKCGTACGSLRKKQKKDCREMDVFFFLESGSNTLSHKDSFVMASTCHRKRSGEYRDVFLEVYADERFRPHFNGKESRDEHYAERVRAFIPGKWVKVEDCSVDCDDTVTSRLTITRPTSSIVIPIQQDAWRHCPQILSCSVSMDAKDALVLSILREGGAVDVNLQKAKTVFHQLSFVFTRLSIPVMFAENKWITLDRNKIIDHAGDDDPVCRVSSPNPPGVKWVQVSEGKRLFYAPLEDGIEAAVYERSLKNRPQPWLVRLSTQMDPGQGNPATHANIHIMIGCNSVSLTQRSYGRFPSGSFARAAMMNQCSNNVDDKQSFRCTYDFRIVEHIERQVPVFPRLKFTSNRNDNKATQPPNFGKYPLRPEQLRSLAWMLQQESSTQPFFEEEVTEAVLPNLGWRAEGRSRRPVLVRGGIIADEVGYGKTAITLGLIDAAEAMNGAQPAPPKKFCQGLLQTNATLVVVPSHLLGQWPEEVTKFCGKSKRVVTIKSMNEMNKVTIRDIIKADIVFVSFVVLCNESYYSRLSRLTGYDQDNMPSKGGRYFDAVYSECLRSLPGRVSDILNDTSNVYRNIENAASEHAKAHSNAKLAMGGKKQAYKDTASKRKVQRKAEHKTHDPWGLRNTVVNRDCNKMTCPPLELFFWNRLVVDEFTYLEKSDRKQVLSFVKNLNSSFRWFLSGTPRHDNFNDIRFLADLLGVHLGIEESLPGVKVSYDKEEASGLDNLSAYMEVRSVQWHERRHALAQEFLDRFVRQNVAEVDEIPSKEHIHKIALSSAERAIYMELETYLRSLDFNHNNARLSKRKSTGDRENRMQQILRESKSSEESLLKCASHLSMPSSCGILDTVQDLIRLRSDQKAALEEELVESLAAAFRQEKRILQYQADWKDSKKSEKGEVDNSLQSFLDAVDENSSVSYGADREVHAQIKKIVKMARVAFIKDQDKVDDVLFRSASTSGSMDSMQLREMKLELRNFMHRIRSLGKELCGRIRSLRYIQSIQRFQQAASSDHHTDLSCPSCRKTGLLISDAGVLSSCGHTGCLGCLRKYASAGQCIQATDSEHECSARVSVHDVVSTNQLGIGGDEQRAGRHGVKLSAVVSKVQEILADGDRTIIFYQFDNLCEKITDALDEAHLKWLQVEKNVNKAIKTVQVFQQAKPCKDDPKILLLKMDDEQSAGLNLTGLNHAIFVHPLLSQSQQDYDAYETQAIGRIRRYGQTKVVHVHRFLAEDTIDTDIFSERGGRDLAATTAA